MFLFVYVCVMWVFMHVHVWMATVWVGGHMHRCVSIQVETWSWCGVSSPHHFPPHSLSGALPKPGAHPFGLPNQPACPGDILSGVTSRLSHLPNFYVSFGNPNSSAISLTPATVNQHYWVVVKKRKHRAGVAALDLWGLVCHRSAQWLSASTLKSPSLFQSCALYREH